MMPTRLFLQDIEIELNRLWHFHTKWTIHQARGSVMDFTIWTGLWIDKEIRHWNIPLVDEDEVNGAVIRTYTAPPPEVTPAYHTLVVTPVKVEWRAIMPTPKDEITEIANTLIRNFKAANPDYEVEIERIMRWR